MTRVITAAALLLAGCVTCSQQVQQRETAGQMGDVDEDSEQRDDQSREIDVSATVPLQ